MCHSFLKSQLSGGAASDLGSTDPNPQMPQGIFGLCNACFPKRNVVQNMLCTACVGGKKESLPCKPMPKLKLTEISCKVTENLRKD